MFLLHNQNSPSFRRSTAPDKVQFGLGAVPQKLGPAYNQNTTELWQVFKKNNFIILHTLYPSHVPKTKKLEFRKNTFSLWTLLNFQVQVSSSSCQVS